MNLTHKNNARTFLFLDSIRGMCALVVMIAHASEKLKGIKTNGILRQHDNFFNSFISFLRYFSHGFAVNVFFILSSFLLTYRLLNDYSRITPPMSIQKLSLCAVKFIIRRFFRVYMPFFVFATAVTLSPKYAGGEWPYESWLKMVTLDNVGFNQLWTISPEIKYYFFIPVICLPSIWPKFNKSCLIMITILTLINIVNMRTNIFDVKYGDDLENQRLWSDNNENFKFCFQYFLNGSLMAFSLFYLENYCRCYSLLVDILNYKGFLVNIVSFLLVVAGVYFDDKKCVVNYCRENLWFKSHYPIANLVWSLHIFLLIISNEKSYLRNVLEQSFFLKETGKLSFGKYKIFQD